MARLPHWQLLPGVLSFPGGHTDQAEFQNAGDKGGKNVTSILTSVSVTSPPH